MSKDRKTPSVSTPAGTAPDTKGPGSDPQDLQGNDFLLQQMMDDKGHEPVHAASPTARKTDPAQAKADQDFLIQRAGQIGYEVMVEDTKLHFRKRDTAEVLTLDDMKRKVYAQPQPARPPGPYVSEETKRMPDGSVVRTVDGKPEVVYRPPDRKEQLPVDTKGPMDTKGATEAKGPGPFVGEEMEELPDGMIVRTVGSAKEWFPGPNWGRPKSATPGPTARKSDTPGSGKP